MMKENLMKVSLADIKDRIQRSHRKKMQKRQKTARKQRWKVLVRLAKYGTNQVVVQGGVCKDVVPKQRYGADEHISVNPKLAQNCKISMTREHRF